MCTREEGDRCDLFFGSNSDVAAAVFWFVSALAIFVRYPVPKPKGGALSPRVTRSGRSVSEREAVADISQAAIQEMGEEGAFVTEEELALPVDGDASAMIPAPDQDLGAIKTGRKEAEAEIV